MNRTVASGGKLGTDGCPEGLLSGLKELYAQVPRPRRRQFLLLMLLMVLNAVAELGTIGTVVPFLSLLADPAGLDRIPWAVGLFEALGAGSPGERLLAATVLFSVFVIIAGALRLLLAWFTQDFVYRLGHDLSLEIQRRILFQPYNFHIHRNTSTLVSAVNKTEILIFSILLPVMQAVTAGFIAFFIILALVYIDPLVATVAAATFTLIYVLVSRFTRERLRANSAEVGPAWDERLKIVQESLGGIRDVIIDNSQSMYLRLFDRVNLRLNLARANTAFISGAPRLVIETAGVVIIAFVALMISGREGGLAVALPVLGAIALGAQRLLPLLQQIYSAWSNIAGNRSVLVQMLGLLRLPVPDEYSDPAKVAPLPLRDRISVKNLNFTFPTRRKQTLHEISFEIPRGSSLGLAGETGSGKSTLADLLMGLLDPDSGSIEIDGARLTSRNRRRWQRSIAHVPQAIFLADTSIARNIALGAADEHPDMEQVIAAAKAAQLHEFVTTLPKGYETLSGERGIRLSGGQRQRLGIARAIYKQAPVLVLDEATSALDEATEAAVMDGLYHLSGEGRTIIIIAHRLSTIARCDRVVRLHSGRIADVRGPASAIEAAGNS